LRQGVSGFGQWQDEHVDLSKLYASIWPGEDMTRIQIAFIAVATRKSSLVTEAVIDGLRVYR
jgi:hypothetical protein